MGPPPLPRRITDARGTRDRSNQKNSVQDYSRPKSTLEPPVNDPFLHNCLSFRGVSRQAQAFALEHVAIPRQDINFAFEKHRFRETERQDIASQDSHAEYGVLFTYPSHNFDTNDFENQQILGVGFNNAVAGDWLQDGGEMEDVTSRYLEVPDDLDLNTDTIQHMNDFPRPTTPQQQPLGYPINNPMAEAGHAHQAVQIANMDYQNKMPGIQPKPEFPDLTLPGLTFLKHPDIQGFLQQVPLPSIWDCNLPAFGPEPVHYATDDNSGQVGDVEFGLEPERTSWLMSECY